LVGVRILAVVCGLIGMWVDLYVIVRLAFLIFAGAYLFGNKLYLDVFIRCAIGGEIPRSWITPAISLALRPRDRLLRQVVRTRGSLSASCSPSLESASRRLDLQSDTRSPTGRHKRSTTSSFAKASKRSPKLRPWLSGASVCFSSSSTSRRFGPKRSRGLPRQRSSSSQRELRAP